MGVVFLGLYYLSNVMFAVISNIKNIFFLFFERNCVFDLKNEIFFCKQKKI